MFDLFRSRDKIVRLFLGAILIVVAASMVTYLIPGSNLGGTGTDDTVLAEVGGQKLTQRDFQRNFSIAMQNLQGATPQMAGVLFPQFLDGQIQQMAVTYIANKMGLKVSDDEVLVGLMNNNSQFFQNGVLNRDAFNQYLSSIGMTEQDAVEQIRDQILRVRLQDAALNTIVVTPQEVKDAFDQRYQKAKISYIAFPATKFTDQVKPTDDQLKKFWEADKAAFPMPAKNSFQVVVVDQEKVAATMNVTDAQLHAAYNTSMDNFRVPERIHVRHILISTQGKNDADKKAALAKAQDILKQLKNGADFATLAKADSDDKGSGEKGGDLDWVVKGQMVPEFENAAFALKPKEISGIVTSQYGYHIIQVLEKEPAHVKPFDEVKASLEDQLKKQGLNDKVQMMGDEIHAALIKSPGSAADIAKQYGADLITVTDQETGKAIPGLGVSPEINDALSQMKPNDVSQELTLPSNRLAVVVLNQHSDARMSTYDEAKDKVRTNYVTQQAQQLAKDKAQEAANRLRQGQDMAAVAKAYNLQVVTSSLFGRADSVEGLGEAVYVQDAFTKPVGSILGPTTINGQDVISKVVENVPADESQFASQKDQILQEVKQRKAEQRNSLLMDSIVAGLTRDGKVKRNEPAIRALAASYAAQQ